MREWENLKPGAVFSYFKEICDIPRGSGQVQAISDYLMRFARERGLYCRKDEARNVVIKKAGSAGYEADSPVILQGHMDMVTVKEAGCEKDMTAEGPDPAIDGDWIYAPGTSLGGDDGIAVAYILALLDADDIAHPPIEAVITSDEEVGMLGASALDVSDLSGRMLINLDSEDEGIFTVSCAGGVTADCRLPYVTKRREAVPIQISLYGLTGGHSGVEIHAGRANAICLLARLLLSLSRSVHFSLISLCCDGKDNAIASGAQAVIATEESDIASAEAALSQSYADIAREYRQSDPQMALSVTAGEKTECTVFDADSTKRTIFWLLALPCGVIRMNPDLPQMVQTSLNAGILSSRDGEVSVSFAVRSAAESEKCALLDKLSVITEGFGGRVRTSGDYPGWAYRKESRLREVMEDAYRAIYQSDPVVEGIHAGLECGIFAAKIPDLDAVSIGPQMEGVHTSKERLCISSAARTWELLLRTLGALHEK